MIQLVNLGQRLKTLRKQHKLTQKQVATRTGLAVSAISSYESGVRYPTYPTLIKFASMYHVTCDYLLGMPTSRTVDVSGLSEAEIEIISQTVNLFRNKHTQ